MTKEYKTDAQEYLYKKPVRRRWHNYGHKILQDNTDRAIRILDLGAGSGWFTSSLLNMGFQNVTAIDLDPEAIEIARKNNITVLHKELSEFPNESFDIIFAFEVIEHIEDLDGFLTLIFSKLKKGGKLIGTTPNAQRWSRILMLTESFDLQPNHLQWFVKEALNFKLEKSFTGEVVVESAFFGTSIQEARFVLVDNIRQKFGIDLNSALGKIPKMARNLVLLTAALPLFVIANLFCLQPNHFGYNAQKK